MAEVTRRRTGEHLRELFALLVPHPDGLPAREALAALANRVQLTEYEAGDYDSGGRRFEKIVRFATVDCVKAGWLLKLKGRWTVTAEGAEAYAHLVDPEDFYGAATVLYRKWRKMQGDERPPEDVPEDEVQRTAAVTLEEAEEAAWGEVSTFLHVMNPYDFQDLVGALIRGLGYHIAWVAPPGKDGGVDLLATPDPLGIGSPRIKIQVKRQSAAVSASDLRSFMATLGSDDVGLFVSLGGFTRDADLEARQQATRRVTLIDIARFYELWVEHYERLGEEDRRRLPLRKVWFLAPE